MRDLTQGRGGDVIVECTGVAEAIPEGLEMARRGGAYFVAGVFADVGDIPINPHRHLLANQIRLFGMTNHPPTGYPSSLSLLNKFKTAYPLKKFVTHEFPVDQVDKAMAHSLRYRRLHEGRADAKRRLAGEAAATKSRGLSAKPRRHSWSRRCAAGVHGRKRLVSDGGRPCKSAADHLEGRSSDFAGRIERRRERAAVAVGSGVSVAGAAEQGRHATQNAADHPAHDAASAVKDRSDRLAGSGYDAAHRPHGPKGIGRRRRRMNDDLTILSIMDDVVIGG